VVRPAWELAALGAVWVVAACASPADVGALHDWVSLDRTVHVVEPASLRAAAPPFATYAALEGLAHARERRTAGAYLEAEAAYRAVLRDPGFTDVAAARYELALVHDALGRAKEAEAGLRWALRHWPAERSTIAYNLGSLFERQERWGQAARAFAQALRLTPAHDLARVGGCHFHLGEIALAQHDDARARDHLAKAVEALPNHGKARARLDALVTA
jgi:tetratricopeptide (TPR) repeat protein